MTDEGLTVAEAKMLGTIVSAMSTTASGNPTDAIGHLFAAALTIGIALELRRGVAPDIAQRQAAAKLIEIATENSEPSPTLAPVAQRLVDLAERTTKLMRSRT